MSRLLRPLVAAGLLAALVTLTEPAGAGPAPTFLNVTTVDDVVNGGDGLVSLREAIDVARGTNGTVIISLPANEELALDLCAAAGTHDDTNVAGDLDLTTGTPDAVIITGGSSEIEQMCATERVLQASGTSLELADVTISGGDIAGESGTDRLGGGVLTNATLLAHQCRFTGNEAYQGGGVFGTAGITFVECLIDGNTGTGGVAAVFGNTASAGIELTRSTVTGNTATSTIVATAQNLDVVNSTISGNTTTNTGSTTTVVSVTGDADLEHALLGLDAINGGGILNVEGDLTSRASIVANDPAVSPVCVIDGTETSEGFNLTSESSCGLEDPTDGTTSLAALSLGAVLVHDTGTPTRMPTGESVVIDAIPGPACTLAVDQRSIARPRTGQCDIGPVEVGLRPDGLVRLGAGSFLGNDDYEVGARDQVRTAERRRGQSATFTVRAENDGETIDDLRVKGLPGNANFSVRYRVGGMVVTGPMTSGSGYLFEDVAPEGRRTIEVTITPKGVAPHGAARLTTVRVTSVAGGTRDVVGARVRVL